MTLSRSLTAVALAALIGVPVIASAQDRALQAAVAARQGQMQGYALNLSVLGGMARGNIEYNADNAQAAADNLVALTGLDQRFLWPEGTDSDSFEGTRAKPEIWQNLEDVISKAVAANEAAVALQAVAADGQAALGPAIGPVGAACTACHDDYRVEE